MIGPPRRSEYFFDPWGVFFCIGCQYKCNNKLEVLNLVFSRRSLFVVVTAIFFMAMAFFFSKTYEKNRIPKSAKLVFPFEKIVECERLDRITSV